MPSEFNLAGRITVQIEDKDGNIKQSCTVENTITDAFLKRSLIASLGSNPAGTALRSISKPTTGQYISTVDAGNFGIYALNREIEITKDTVVPPYVTGGCIALASDVVFYNNTNTLVESAKELLAVDNRSVYRRKAGDHSFIVEYVKNSGIGSVKSICFGRQPGYPNYYVGSAIGEAIYQAIWTTGTVEYFLEQRLTGTSTALCPLGKQQETIVWKQVSSSSQFSANLVTKQVTPYTTSNLSTNLLNSNLVGGHVFGSNVLKATYSASSVEAHTYSLLLSYCTNITGSTAINTRVLTFSIPEYVTACLSFYPVMVSRPDTAVLEIFVTAASGTFNVPTGEEDETEPVTGCLVYKLTLSTPTDPANSEIITESLGILPYGIGQQATTAVTQYVSGFYFADLQNDDSDKTDKETPEGVYYLPYVQYHDGTTLFGLNNSSWAMGVAVSEDFTEIKGEYLARSSASQEFNAPVMTDTGILFCRVNSTTMYYVTLSGVISGATLPQTLVKRENDILRLMYEYTLT
jgi:hypothetical protein